MMHCWDDKYEYHDTLADATTACVADSSCIGVYDHGCEQKGYYLCPMGAIQKVWYSNPIKSCVHIKKGIVILNINKHKTIGIKYK
jgi:hypothetical protein